MLLALFLLAAMIDEKGNDLADAKKIKGALASFLRYRLLLEVTVLAVTVYTGVWEMFFGVFLFDVGYIFTDKLTKAVA